MTYVPKPGDRVTSPLLVGEWTVGGCANPTSWWEVYDAKGNTLEMYVGNLNPVAPPLPPEPAVGEVVWTGARYWIHGSDGTWCSPGVGFWQSWDSLVADAEPVVPVSKVADWMNSGGSCCGPEQVRDLLDEFGWDK